MREKTIEKRLVAETKLRGGMAVKTRVSECGRDAGQVGTAAGKSCGFR